jgi:hypothetical protein
MGLIINLLTLPLAPVRATIAVAEQIRRQAESEYYDPARIRLQLDEIDDLRQSGALEADEADALEDELLARLFVANERLQVEEA